jgi:quercetin dioxygenase-like cupin family protein
MTRIQKAVLAAFVALPVVTGVALATAPSGIISAPVHARGTNADVLNVHSKAGVKLQTKSSVDFVTQQIRMAPGGTTGWHSHPGPVLVTIKSGQLTLVYADDATCEGRTYGPGESFVDRGDEIVHTAINEGSTEVEFWATYFVPGAPGAPARLDSAGPGTCSF